jgi:hypothetical protein
MRNNSIDASIKLIITIDACSISFDESIIDLMHALIVLLLSSIDVFKDGFNSTYSRLNYYVSFNLRDSQIIYTELRIN